MKAVAPGKLILSGEHSVVYGKPALALAVNQFAKVEIKEIDSLKIECHGFDKKHSLAIHELETLKKELDTKHNQYLNETLNVNQILKHPSELVFYCVAHFIKHTELNYGLSLSFEFDFPIGCGMGASAACISATLTALNDYFQRPFNLEQLFELSIQAENLQHGKSSGLDCRMSLNGGLILLQRSEMQRLPMTDLPFYMLNTGKPDCTTGECVEQVRKFKDDGALWDQFRDITLGINDALQNKDIPELMLLVKENHKLLCHIGVVPEAQQDFIKQCEKQGIAAKLSGAGAISGNSGGICLLFSEDEEKITHFKDAIRITGENHGAHSL